MRTFVDTNVLVYAQDVADPDKHGRALAVLAELDPVDLVVSAQVLNEFFVVVTRPGRELMPVAEARALVVTMSATAVEPVDADLVRRSVALHARYSLSHWDSLIVAAAARSGSRRLLSEDLGAGDVIDGVRIENPFTDPTRQR